MPGGTSQSDEGPLNTHQYSAYGLSAAIATPSPLLCGGRRRGRGGGWDRRGEKRGTVRALAGGRAHLQPRDSAVGAELAPLILLRDARQAEHFGN
jgi:hypothetical protein